MWASHTRLCKWRFSQAYGQNQYDMRIKSKESEMLLQHHNAHVIYMMAEREKFSNKGIGTIGESDERTKR